MPCDLCKRKCGVPFDCSYCSGKFCIKCMRLEKHNCIGMEIKKEKDRQSLKDKLTYETNPKHLKI